jgi:hypothetical protein
MIVISGRLKASLFKVLSSRLPGFSLEGVHILYEWANMNGHSCFSIVSTFIMIEQVGHIVEPTAGGRESILLLGPFVKALCRNKHTRLIQEWYSKCLWY